MKKGTYKIDLIGTMLSTATLTVEVEADNLEEAKLKALSKGRTSCDWKDDSFGAEIDDNSVEIDTEAYENGLREFIPEDHELISRWKEEYVQEERNDPTIPEVYKQRGTAEYLKHLYGG